MLLPVKEYDAGSNPAVAAILTILRKETILMKVWADELTKKDYTEKYTNKDRTKRINHQYQRLCGKINYMNKLTNMGRKFGRNAPCPCKSGRKFKHCCIVNHEHNEKKVSALQLAMTKLHVKISKYGLKIGRVGVSA